MKKLLLFLIFLTYINVLQAQAPENTPAAKLAHHIADKLKDTLGLTNQQRAKVFKINMDLSIKKMNARKKSNDRIVVGEEIQRIEKLRDALYKEVLSEQQYLLYVEKKRNLVTAR